MSRPLPDTSLEVDKVRVFYGAQCVLDGVVAAITALVLLVPSILFMLVIERFFTAEALAKIG